MVLGRESFKQFHGVGSVSSFVGRNESQVYIYQKGSRGATDSARAVLVLLLRTEKGESKAQTSKEVRQRRASAAGPTSGRGA